MSAHEVREDREIVRTPLLERVAAARPEIISLIAPAGFGKTTLVRQLLREQSACTICDCRGVDSDLALARRVVAALADENPDRAASLSQSEGLLRDGPSTADRITVAIAAWRVRTHPAAFVFENAEDAIGNPAARDLLARLLGNRPAERTIVICSRESLRMHLSRFAAPHQILTLRASELAFTNEEVRRLFGDVAVSPETIERVVEVSSGWPIAVLLFVRFAHEGRLESLLDKLGDVAFEELHEYLADQVLGSLPPALLDALVASAAIPQPKERDIALATDPIAAQQLVEFERTSPFVARTAAGAFALHPLVATLLVERHPGRVHEILERAAQGYELGGEWLRAAELYLARGDQETAARALNEHEVIEEKAPPIEYSRVLAAIDHSIVLRHPRLWAVTALLRTFTTDPAQVLREAEGIWATLAPDTPPIVRIYIFVFRVLYMSYLGDFEQALRLVDEFRTAIAAPPVPQTKMHGWLLFMRSLMTARMGRLSEAQRDLDAAWPLISTMYVMASGTLVTMGGDIARARGDRETERTLIERAIETARKSGLSNFIAFDEAEATFGAWLAGDEAEFLQYAFALEAEVEREGMYGLAFFASCARRRPRLPTSVDLPRYTACGHLIVCADAEDRETAYEHALAAVEAAQQYKAPFFETLAAIAVAAVGPPSARAEALAQAQHFASQVDSEPLRQALAAIESGGDDAGFLTGFWRRLRRDRRNDRNAIVIELVCGRVRRGDAVISLPERELTLLLACALRPEALTRERLTDQLWPDLSESAARNAFHVCMHRLKQHLQDDVIIRTKDGYRLRNDVRVDLWEIDRLMSAMRTSEALSEESVATLRELFERLQAERPARFANWEWFEQTERRLRELRSEVTHALAKHALACGQHRDALEMSRALIAHDPCDEPAREIAITAYLASGDRAAALRHFRQYRETLRAELDCEPSEAIAKLVGA
ncbi:MAG TPA: BTAD domain-containing putative transcriptional regulator [Candidatus Acidoferrales bacterium]|nr:BTAD domain-containing putative transcriptional regulator [Candidatus Acidoferrales bacterium]